MAKNKSNKQKSKISTLVNKCDSDNDGSEQELSYYINDRVKLMKEVLKIIKPKKIKSMAPDCIKDLDLEEINSMLLEELLGISNKRLKYIFSGQNPSEDSSSTDPEEERHPIDVISLDDVSDDDFFVVESDATKKGKTFKKEELKVKEIKKEKHDKSKGNIKKRKEPLQEENLMNVLELLELQARARAIRSQLMLETNKNTLQEKHVKVNEDSDTDDAVIIELPKTDEIVITSSDSENEKTVSNIEKLKNTEICSVLGQSKHEGINKKKIKLVRNRIDTTDLQTTSKSIDVQSEEVKEIETNTGNNEGNHLNINKNNSELPIDKKELQSSHNNLQREKNSDLNHDDDEIILIVDQEEMDGIIGE